MCRSVVVSLLCELIPSYHMHAQWRSQDNKSGRAHSGGFYEVEEAPGKGVPLPPSEGVRESAVSSPIGVWGSAPRANAFLIQQ